MWGLYFEYFVSFDACKVVTWSFDKSLHRIILKQRDMGSEEIKKDSIDNISMVTLDEAKLTKIWIRYRIIIVLKPWQAVPLTSYYISGSEMPKLAKLISEFLNIPLLSKSV